MQMSNRSSTGHDATGESNWKVTGKPGRHIGVTGCLRVSQGVEGRAQDRTEVTFLGCTEHVGHPP